MSSAIVSVVLIATLVCSALAECPNGIIEKGVNKSEIEIIVEKHNFLRGLLAKGELPDQPKGINFKTMKYSDELAKEAQKIADTCEFEHKAVTGTKWQQVGQNLYMSMNSRKESGSDWNAAIQSWFDEHKMYIFGHGPSSSTGHYTQVVWAETDHVGCGYSFFKDDGWYEKIYVCNYGPAGNIVGQYPYKIVRGRKQFEQN